MLLAKKDRGKPTEAQRQIVLAPFGADKAKEFLDGVETLPMENDEEAMDVEGIFRKYAAKISTINRLLTYFRSLYIFKGRTESNYVFGRMTHSTYAFPLSV